MLTINAEWEKNLRQAAGRMGIPIDPSQASKMARHATELLLWNRKTNLTAITNPLEMIERHYLDSLAALTRLKSDGKLLDMGSGGGFPGIPLKIALSHLEIVLVDASRKKVNFLRHTLRSLNLKSASAIQARLELLAKEPRHQKRYDTVICRAFSELDTILLLGHPFLAAQGRIICLKGPKGHAELINWRETINAKSCSLANFSMTSSTYKLPLSGETRMMILADLVGS